jgi:hypothetical protein
MLARGPSKLVADDALWLRDGLARSFQSAPNVSKACGALLSLAPLGQHIKTQTT